MRAAPRWPEVDLTRAKTNKGRFWWELRKCWALSQQADLIEMQMQGRGGASSCPLTSHPRAPSPAVQAEPAPGTADPARLPTQAPRLAVRSGMALLAVNHHLITVVVILTLP